MQPLVTFQNAQNPLYGGRDQLLPTDYPETAKQNMNEKHLALGILETQGLTAILEATDAMLKAANVTLVGKEKIGAAYVTVIVKGDVAAVTAAVEAGQRAVGNLGKLVAAHVIARPHEELAALLPK
jgi:microcompartment protein CcmL/EutN